MKYLVDVIYKSRATIPIEAESLEEARQIAVGLVNQGIKYEPAMDVDPIDPVLWEVRKYDSERDRMRWGYTDPLFHPKSDVRED